MRYKWHLCCTYTVNAAAVSCSLFIALTYITFFFLNLVRTYWVLFLFVFVGLSDQEEQTSV